MLRKRFRDRRTEWRNDGMTPKPISPFHFVAGDNNTLRAISATLYIAAKPWDWLMMSNFFLLSNLSFDDPQKISYRSDVAFYTCNNDVITKAPMTYKKRTLVSHEDYLTGVKFQFFPWSGFRDAEVESLSFFPTWLPHHMTYDVIIIIKSFYLSNRTSGENFVLIG